MSVVAEASSKGDAYCPPFCSLPKQVILVRDAMVHVRAHRRLITSSPPRSLHPASVCGSRYLEIVSELLLTVRQMENTLNKRRVTARRGSRQGGGDQGPSDKDKIMMQAWSVQWLFGAL